MNQGAGNDMGGRPPAVGRERNPFLAPEAHVEDVGGGEAGELIENGQRVPAGNGVQWIASGWELFRMAPGVWIGLSVAFLALMIVMSFIPIVNFAVNLLVPVLVGGIMLGCRALEDGEPLEFGHLFAGFRTHTGNLVLIGVFYLLGFILIGVLAGILAAAFMGGMAMNGGFEEGSLGIAMLPMLLIALVVMLFAVPLAMAFWFAPALVVLHDVPAFAAMKMSFLACLKNFLPFLLYGIVLLVLTVIAMLPLFLGLLVLWPVMWGSTYASYRDMFVG